VATRPPLHPPADRAENAVLATAFRGLAECLQRSGNWERLARTYRSPWTHPTPANV